MEKEKAMISQPMAGKAKNEIVMDRNRAIARLESLGYEVINTLFTDEWHSKESMEERGVVQAPLCFLAKSLENMSLCHAVFFVKGWENARGCKIEREAAEKYGLTIIDENNVIKNILRDMNYVDLGLPSGTLWADRNVGAGAPEEHGEFLTWDEAVKLDVLLPDMDNIRELIRSCQWTWSDGGYTVTGKNGSSIFLPAAGCRRGSALGSAGYYGYYWSRSLGDGYADSACGLYFGSGYVDWGLSNRYRGQSVRPVITRNLTLNDDN